ncbi:hypothetical protein WA026_015826 [Henosepilachna vigintioctopunctata]|uniref:Uncharacterized protein n=1 Tax=Henosepilachna vigintioctopunctata TaxID=420089 RepID=A0AAW1UUY4_9CUCU
MLKFGIIAEDAPGLIHLQGNNCEAPSMLTIGKIWKTLFKVIKGTEVAADSYQILEMMILKSVYKVWAYR